MQMAIFSRTVRARVISRMILVKVLTICFISHPFHAKARGTFRLAMRFWHGSGMDSDPTYQEPETGNQKTDGGCDQEKVNRMAATLAVCPEVPITSCHIGPAARIAELPHVRSADL